MNLELASHWLIVVLPLTLAFFALSRSPSRIVREPVLSVTISVVSSTVALPISKVPLIVKASEEFKSLIVTSLTSAEIFTLSLPAPVKIVALSAPTEIESLPLPALIESAPPLIIVSAESVATTIQSLEPVLIFCPSVVEAVYILPTSGTTERSVFSVPVPMTIDFPSLARLAAAP